MKIKQTKQMRLDELIKYVWESGRHPSVFKSDIGGSVAFSVNGKFTTYESHIPPGATFTIEVDEELTEDMYFNKLSEVYYNEKAGHAYMMLHFDATIEAIKAINRPSCETLAIYHGKTLIWSAENGIPKDGIVEV